MLVKTYSAAVNGLDVTTVRVEVNIVPGVMYHLTGLGDTAVREVATALHPLYSSTDISFRTATSL